MAATSPDAADFASANSDWVTAEFTASELACLARTAADLLYGDPADLSERQARLTRRVKELMDQETDLEHDDASRSIPLGSRA